MAYYRNPKFLRSANQGGPLYRSYKEAAGQSWKQGQLVHLHGSSGDGLTICATGDTSVLGIACADATGVTGTLAKVLVIRPGDEIQMDVWTGSTVDAATTAMLMVNYGMTISAGESLINLNETGADVFTLQQILDDDAIKVAVTVLASTLQYNVGM